MALSFDFEGKAYVKNPNLIIYCVQKAVDKCPSNAIILEEGA
jgi:ferredoxin